MSKNGEIYKTQLEIKVSSKYVDPPDQTTINLLGSGQINNNHF